MHTELFSPLNDFVTWSLMLRTESCFKMPVVNLVVNLVHVNLNVCKVQIVVCYTCKLQIQLQMQRVFAVCCVCTSRNIVVRIEALTCCSKCEILHHSKNFVCKRFNCWFGSWDVFVYACTIKNFLLKKLPFTIVKTLTVVLLPFCRACSYTHTCFMWMWIYTCEYSLHNLV